MVTSIDSVGAVPRGAGRERERQYARHHRSYSERPEGERDTDGGAAADDDRASDHAHRHVRERRAALQDP